MVARKALDLIQTRLRHVSAQCQELYRPLSLCLFDSSSFFPFFPMYVSAPLFLLHPPRLATTIITFSYGFVRVSLRHGRSWSRNETRVLRAVRAIASARPPGGAFLSPVPCSSSNFPRDVVGQQPRYAATRMELLQVKFEAGKSSRWRFLRITSSARSWGTLFYLKLLPSYQVFFAFGAVCDETKRMKRLRCYA